MTETMSMREFAAFGKDPPRSSDQSAADRHVLRFLQERNGGGGGVGAGGPMSSDDWLEATAARGANRAGRRRNSGDFLVVETAHFLRTCGLCRRRLGPGRDTFMYRGDIAFCSLECRQQHMNQEDLKEKCSSTSMKDTSPSSSTSDKSDTGEAVSAA